MSRFLFLLLWVYSKKLLKLRQTADGEGEKQNGVRERARTKCQSWQVSKTTVVMTRQLTCWISIVGIVTCSFKEQFVKIIIPLLLQKQGDMNSEVIPQKLYPESLYILVHFIKVISFHMHTQTQLNRSTANAAFYYMCTRESERENEFLFFLRYISLLDMSLWPEAHSEQRHHCTVH